jgi:hypothetical protein
MVKLLAHHEIWRASGRMIPTGEFDREGNAKVRAETIVIAPGSYFESDDAEAERLVAEGAAFSADDHNTPNFDNE